MKSLHCKLHKVGTLKIGTFWTPCTLFVLGKMVNIYIGCTRWVEPPPPRTHFMDCPLIRTLE